MIKGVSVLTDINEGKNGCQLKVEQDDKGLTADTVAATNIGKMHKSLQRENVLSSRRCPSTNKDE